MIFRVKDLRYNSRMLLNPAHKNIDYLVIGHITRDISDDGERLGGSAAYAAKTAAAFGLRVGILTSWGEDIDIEELSGIHIINSRMSDTTTFENKLDGDKRSQIVHQLAAPIEIQQLPSAWNHAKIVHFAPVIGEISPGSVRAFPEADIGLTPQGWLRGLENDGRVIQADWPEADFVVQSAMATVISQEDISRDADILDSMAASSAILAVTDAEKGAQIFNRGKVSALPANPVREVDSVGAGDIFAAAFFIRLHYGDNVEEAGRVANQVAAQSVERRGLKSTPSFDEVYDLIPRALQE